MTAFAPFSFSTVPHLVPQAGAAGQLGQHVGTHFPLAPRAMIVAGPGFLRAALVDAPARDLEQHNMTVWVYSDVMADPPEHIVLNAVDFARQQVTTGETTKMDVVAPQMYADLAVLDAELTLGLPPLVTAAAGTDAMVHVVPHVLRVNMAAAVDRTPSSPASSCRTSKAVGKRAPKRRLLRCNKWPG